MRSLSAAQNRGELHFQQFRPMQQQPDAAQPKRWIGAGVNGCHAFSERRDILLTAPIQHANGHRVMAHGFQDLAIGRALRFLIRQILAVHEQEFRA